MPKIEELEEEQENSYNEEIYQYYIVSDHGARILEEINDRIANISYTSPYQDEIGLIVDGLERARDTVEYAFAADVVEVVHGEWLTVEYNDGSVFKECSNCGARKQQRYYNFCSNCGAKMDGKGN